MQKLLLMVAELQGILKLTPDNMVEPINTSTDRKCFCQLRGSEMIKDKKRGLLVPLLRQKNKKEQTKAPQQTQPKKRPLTNKKPSYPPLKTYTGKKEKPQAEACMDFY